MEEIPTAKVLATAPSRPQLKRHGRTLALALAQRRPLQLVVLGWGEVVVVVVSREEIGVVGRDEVVVGREEVGFVVERVEEVEGGGIVWVGDGEEEEKEEEANVVPLGYELEEEFMDDDKAGEKVDEVVLAGRADDVVGLPPRPRPRLRHRSPVHPSAAVEFTVVFDGLDMVVGGCVVGKEVVLVLTEEEVDEDKGGVAGLGEVLDEFVEVLPPPIGTEDEGDVADITVFVGSVDELDVVLPPLPPKIGRLTLTHSSPEHPESEAGTDGDEMLVEGVVIVEFVGLMVELVGLNVEVTVETKLPASVVVSTETLMHVVPVHELAPPEPVAIITDDGNDGGVVLVVDGALPPPRPSERQRSPLQDDAAEGDSTVARVVATLLPNDEEGGDSVNVCVIV
ncbi:MAG: hypothetical protein Q9180_003891 [Flavoplaca navasiana]